MAEIFVTNFQEIGFIFVQSLKCRDCRGSGCWKNLGQTVQTISLQVNITAEV